MRFFPALLFFVALMSLFSYQTLQTAYAHGENPHSYVSEDDQSEGKPSTVSSGISRHTIHIIGGFVLFIVVIGAIIRERVGKRKGK